MAGELRPVRPSRPPTQRSLADQKQWVEAIRGNLAEQLKRAEGWRNGLSAFLTLILSALVISGRGAVTPLGRTAQFVVVTLIVAGLALAVGGLWMTLDAQYGGGFRRRTRIGDGRDETVDQLEARQVQAIITKLNRARRLVAVAIGVLVAGVATSWLVPDAAPSPPGFVVVHQLSSSEAPCGTLLSADLGKLRLSVAGESAAREIPFTDVKNLTLVAGCP